MMWLLYDTKRQFRLPIRRVEAINVCSYALRLPFITWVCSTRLPSWLCQLQPLESLPGTQGIEELRKTMRLTSPIIGQATVFNDSRKKKRRTLTIDDLVSNKTSFPTVVIPIGEDGSMHHAFCAVDDLVFDSTQPFALKCKRETMGWVCDTKRNGGDTGVMGISRAY